VAEGFATAGTVALAMGEAVCCVFTCGNLIPALEILTQRMPGATFVLAADNDATKPDNPGRTAAIGAARRFCLTAVWPTFPHGKAGSDFDDLALEIGIDAVREELQKAFPIPPTRRGDSPGGQSDDASRLQSASGPHATPEGQEG
jgi:putative DNA primase/helicase